MPDLRVVAHNLHAGAGNQGQRKAKGAVSLQRAHDAQVGVWTEAKTAVEPFRDIDGVRTFSEDPLPRRADAPLPEHGDVAVTVTDQQVRRWRAFAHSLRWVVRRYNRWHQPSRDVAVMLRGRVRGVRGVHLPPGGPYDPANGKAWREQMDAALKWADRRGCRAIVGDLNAGAPTVALYAAERGYAVKVDGVGVDLCVVSGGTVTATNLGRQGDGYDHPAVLFDIAAHGRK